MQRLDRWHSTQAVQCGRAPAQTSPSPWRTQIFIPHRAHSTWLSSRRWHHCLSHQLSFPQHHHWRITAFSVQSIVPAIPMALTWALVNWQERDFQPFTLEETESPRGLGELPGLEPKTSVYKVLEPVASQRKILSPRGLWQSLESILVFTTCRGRGVVLVALSG